MLRVSDVLASEALRLRSRRISLALVLMMPLLAVVLTVLQGAVHHDDYAAARARFEENRSAQYDEERANFLQMQRTMGDQLPAGARDLTRAEYASGANFFGGRDKVVTNRYDARTDIPDTAQLMAVGLVLLAFVLGAFHLGRDWTSGSLPGLLTWYPQRVRVTLVKVTVVLVPTLVAGLGAFALVWLGGLLDGSLRGTDAGLGGEWWRTQAWYAVRACAAAGLAGMLGVGIAHLSRAVTAPLGAVVAVLVLDPVLGGLVPAVKPWLVTSLLRTLLEWGHTFRSFDGTRLVGSVSVSGLTALAVLVAGTAAVLLAAVVATVRRDAL